MLKVSPVVDLRLLRFFIAIFEERNITLAAQRCHVSQPSLSAGLKQLEQELGCTLFERSKKGVVALGSAHYLYPLAVRLVKEASALPLLFKQKAARQKLRIAVMPDLSQRRLAGLLSRVNQAVERLDLELVDYHRAADCRLTLDALKREDEVFMPLWSEDYVLCVPRRHELAQKAVVEPADLNGYDFIECPPCEAHQQTIGLLACADMSLNLVAKAEHKSLVVSLVLAGFGISFLPDGLVEAEPGLELVRFNGPRMYRRIGLCYPSHQTLNPVISQLILGLSLKPEVAGD